MSIEKSDYVNKKHIDKCDYANYNVRIATNKRRRKRGEIDEKKNKNNPKKQSEDFPMDCWWFNRLDIDSSVNDCVAGYELISLTESPTCGSQNGLYSGLTESDLATE